MKGAERPGMNGYFTVTNPENGHAHLFYGLKTPARTAEGSSIKALRYAAAIQSALREVLGADPGYAGFICKNPFHPCWITEIRREELYELKDLHRYLDLTTTEKRRESSDSLGLQRNCKLFERLRHWAYSEYVNTWPGKEEWRASLTKKAQQMNAFLPPLPPAEVEAIAASVARFTIKKFTQEKFSQIQSRRGAAGGKAKGKANEFKRKTALKQIKDGKPQVDVAKFLGISTRTIRRWQNSQPDKSHIR